MKIYYIMHLENGICSATTTRIHNNNNNKFIFDIKLIMELLKNKCLLFSTYIIDTPHSDIDITHSFEDR